MPEDHRQTEMVIVLDRSSSMGLLYAEALEGFNGLLKKLKSELAPTLLTLALFDDGNDFVYRSIDVRNAKPLNPGSFEPEGTTALLDAIGRTIDDLRERRREEKTSKPPGRTIMVILTDGREDASIDYTEKAVARKIARLRHEEGWEFIFAAAGHDAVGMAELLNIPVESAVPFAPTREGVRKAWSSIADRLMDFIANESGDEREIRSVAD